MWHPERCDVALNHGHVGSREPLPQVSHPAGMQLDGDHARTRRNQVCGQRSVAGTKVDDQLPGAYAGVLDDGRGPVIDERMPTPGSPGPP